MTDCVHWYELDSPEGPTITGKCRNCADVRQWPNHVMPMNGRPFILKDPLMPRLFNAGYGGPRPRTDYY